MKYIKSIRALIKIIIRKFRSLEYMSEEEDRMYCYQKKMESLFKGGLKIGKNCTIEPTAYLDPAYPYLISIGDNCSIASGVRILAHDATVFKFTDGYVNINKVEIKDNVFIAENAIILPGVSIGPNVVVAAGSVVNKDIPPNSCVCGVPARFYSTFDAFIVKHKEQIKVSRIFDFYDLHRNPDQTMRLKLQEAIKTNTCYSKGERGNPLWYRTLNRDGSSPFA